VNPHIYTTPNRPGALLRSAGVRPSKARGQNFLVQSRIASQIVERADVGPDDSIVEIGAGLGVLSELLAKARPRSLRLIEVDSRLAAGLAMRFADDSRVTVIHDDILRLEYSGLGAGPIKVIGNLPFSIAAAVLRRLCDYRASIARMVLMFQSEVGERIRASTGSGHYGALSVFTSLYWQITDHFKVAAGSFHPRPKVDTEVLVLNPWRMPCFDPEEESDIKRTIRAAFSAPRKTIRNSLAGGLGVEPEVVQSALLEVGIDPAARPATLGRDHLIALAHALRPAPQNEQ
jgi:16S rRNA (adenine1518-N6/adenine1519-N6)-dimethyltransferase